MADDALARLKKANEDRVVLGLKSVTGVLPRQDIDILLRDDPDVLNLFLLALAALQDEDMVKERMGYFQIAGIHGLPKTPWDGVEAPGKEEGSVDPSGYCAHSTPTFPTWHRPYLAMMEQTLYIQMLDIAGNYKEPHKAKYKAAAQRFRLPFWDYFRPRDGPVEFPGVIDEGKTSYAYDYKAPRIFTEPSIMVRKGPDDKLSKLPVNPLYQYQFGSGLKPSDWNNSAVKDPKYYPRDATVRYPVHEFDPKFGQGGTETMNIVLNNLRMDTNRLILHMLHSSVYNKYDDFASNGAPQKPTSPRSNTKTEIFVWEGASGSLEDIHGMYHGLVGGMAIAKLSAGGHMSRVPIAAFDPIFWMHHCQIDRFFAVWQAVHDKNDPESWFSDSAMAESDLLPFRTKAGKHYWNSNDSRSTQDFGYTYPEIQSTSEATWDVFSKMYEWSVPLQKPKRDIKAPPGMEPIDVSKSQFFRFDGEDPATTGVGTLSESISIAKQPALQKPVELVQKAIYEDPVPSKGYSREWFIDDRVQRLALNGEFTILYFISDDKYGHAPASFHQYLMSPSLAAITYIFAAPTELCNNCGHQDEQAHIVTSTASITSFLLDFVEVDNQPLASLEPEHVVPFLQQRLKWRIITPDGELADPRNLASTKDLKINVNCKVAPLPRDSGGEVQYERYPEIIDHIIQAASPTAESIQA